MNTHVSGRKGFGTVEIVLIAAVLISLALMFRSSITAYARKLMTSTFGNAEPSCESGEDPFRE